MDRMMNSPRVRLTVTLVLTILIGVLSSLFATEIAPGGEIDVTLIHQVFSFWALIVVGGIWIFLNFAFLKHDENILKFTDDAHCLGYIRKTKLDGFAALIQKDPAQARLINVTDLLKDLKVKAK